MVNACFEVDRMAKVKQFKTADELFDQMTIDQILAATPSVDEVFDECMLFPSRFGRDCYRMEEVTKYVTDKEVCYDIKVKHRRRGFGTT